jgi:hypothetical protein
MKTRETIDHSETATTGIVIGIIDLLAMIIVIVILCTADFGF